jgi:outer membrane protein
MVYAVRKELRRPIFSLSIAFAASLGFSRAASAQRGGGGTVVQPLPIQTPSAPPPSAPTQNAPTTLPPQTTQTSPSLTQQQAQQGTQGASSPMSTSVSGSITAGDGSESPSTLALSLADAERAATTEQPQVILARTQTAAADARAREARSYLLPQLTGTAEYLRETGNYQPRPGGIVTTSGTATSGSSPSNVSLTQSYDFWTFGLTANQLIYDFGQTWGKYKAAQATTEAQKAAEQALKLQILFNVRKAYYNACAQKGLVEVAKETLQDQQRHLVQIEGFVRAGTNPEIDLAQGRTVVANAQVSLIQAQNNYAAAKAALNQAAGLFTGTSYDVGSEEAPAVADEDASLDTLAKRAVAARPELAEIEKQREAQKKTLDAIKGGYGPSLSATAGGSYAGVALDGLVPNWDVGLILSWPIFQGGLTRAQVDEAAANLEGVDAQKNVELLQIRLDVETARLAVVAAKSSIGAANDALVNGREQLRLAEARYSTGVGSIIELNDAQVAYASAEAQVVIARYTLATARVQLLAALGRT